MVLVTTVMYKRHNMSFDFHEDHPNFTEETLKVRILKKNIYCKHCHLKFKPDMAVVRLRG